MALAIPASAGSPVRFALHLNDGFDVSSTRLACIVQHRKGAPSNALLCFRETAIASYKPEPGSYVLVYGQGGLGVLREAAVPKRVFVRYQRAPSGKPQGANTARPLLGGVGRLHSGDRIYVAGTNIVCEAMPRPQGLFCSLVGADNRLHYGTYAATVTDGGLVIFRVDVRARLRGIFHIRNPH